MLLIPAFALAVSADRFVAKTALPSDAADLVVPLEISNTKDLVALDIPLQFSEGAYLDKVVFTERVESFEFKHANIDNEKRIVVIGMISMVTADKPDLATGQGPLAELHFKLDPGAEGVTLTPIEIESPNHSLTYYYNDYSSGRPEVRTIRPEIESIEIQRPAPGQALPTVYALMQNTPNPFNPMTKVHFDMPVAGDVNLSVFNVLGQHVTDLVNGYREAGSHEAVWEGKDKTGATVASGIYFYRIKTNEFTDTKKMVLLK
jgi:hypothetical protein